MLPYGALWKLDHALHPVGPGRARTPQLRRRRALFVFVVASLISLVFLLPYHGAHLRRVYTERAREASGLKRPARDLHAYSAQRAMALGHLRRWQSMNGGSILTAADANGKDAKNKKHPDDHQNNEDAAQETATDRGGDDINDGRERVRMAEALAGAWHTAFYFVSAELYPPLGASGLPGIVDSTALRELAGAGAGTHWRLLTPRPE